MIPDAPRPGEPKKMMQSRYPKKPGGDTHLLWDEEPPAPPRERELSGMSQKDLWSTPTPLLDDRGVVQETEDHLRMVVDYHNDVRAVSVDPRTVIALFNALDAANNRATTAERERDRLTAGWVEANAEMMVALDERDELERERDEARAGWDAEVRKQNPHNAVVIRTLQSQLAAAESRATTAEQNDALSMAMRTYLENKLARAESHLSTTRSALERIAKQDGKVDWWYQRKAADALKETE